MPNSAYHQLVSVFDKVGRIEGGEQLLFWESRTMMPPGGMESRAKILATLRILATELVAAPRVGDLLNEAESRERGKLAPWEAANLREMQRRWRYATAVPARAAGRHRRTLGPCAKRLGIGQEK